MDGMKNIEAVYLMVSAKPGSEINDCIADAISVAMENGTDVDLRHNDSAYYIGRAQIIRLIENKKRSGDTEGN